MPEQHAMIYFRCTNPAHQHASSNKSDMLTIHEGKWAYCGHDIRAKGHTWAPTGGQTLEQVRSAQRRTPQQ